MLDDPLELLGGLKRKERDGGALAEGNSGKQTQKGGKKSGVLTPLDVWVIL